MIFLYVLRHTYNIYETATHYYSMQVLFFYEFFNFQIWIDLSTFPTVTIVRESALSTHMKISFRCSM
jgi:hypothetical protein